MCFNQPMSGLFAGLGLFLSYYVYSTTGNKKLTAGVFFFFTMEFLQFVQYFWLNDCDSGVNQVLTLLGFLHICLQPYFTHLINASLTKNPYAIAKWDVVHKLCLVGGFALFLRWALTYFPGMPRQRTTDLSTCPSNEWLRGEKLCTYAGKYHLAWAVPMVDSSYQPWEPGVAIHSFLMFAPFFCVNSKSWIQGLFLYGTGPALGAWFTTNLQEQASIWCFFSIAQIACMVLLIRKHVILKKKRAGGKKKA